MKRFFSLLLALVLVCTLSFGCLGPKVIKPEDPKTVSVLIKKLNKCPENNGWKILSIPEKKEVMESNRERGVQNVVAVVYKKGDVTGYGLVAEGGGSVVVQWDPEKNTWVFIWMGFAKPVSEEEIKGFWSEWSKVVLEKFDIEAAYCGMPTFPAPDKNT